ncbi:MAG TPA: TonB-dependent receptor [Chthoniobacterales bacterium]
MKHFQRLSLAAICSIFLCSRILAQEPSPSPSPEANETAVAPLVITGQALPAYNAEEATSATRLPVPILDSDRSVQVITQQLLQDRDIIDPQDAVQDVSGVERGGSRTGIGETYFIRGFEQGSLFKDGFRAGELSGGDVFTFVGPTDIADISRIEVLKGPSAILYGRGEPGGTVNYITRTPAFENQFSLEQQVGSYDFYRTQLDANWNVVPGRFALGLDAAYENTGSFIDFAGDERRFLAPAFAWKIDKDTLLVFRGEYSNDDSATATALPYDNGRVIPGIPYNRYLGEPGFSDIDTRYFRGLLTLEHRWNDSQKTTLSIHAARSDADGGNFILYPFVGSLQDPVTGDITRDAEKIKSIDDYFTARLDHVWDWTIYNGSSTAETSSDDKNPAPIRGGGFPTVMNQVLFSADFDRQTIDGQRILSGQAPINPYDPVYTGYAPQPLVPGFPVTFLERTGADADATSLLLLDRLSFGDTAYLSFGGRYEWFDADAETHYPLGNVPFGNTTVNGDSLAPESARQFEVGTKGEFLEGKLLATVAVFQIDKSDVAATDPNNPLFSINGGDERSRGVEFDISAEPLPGLRLSANYDYINARVTADPLGLDVGDRLPSVPENSGGLFTTYEIQDGCLKGLGFGGGFYLSDRVEVDRENSGDLSGWAQTDALIYYKRGGTSARSSM